MLAERLSTRSWMAELLRATDIPWAEELMLAANNYLTTVVDELSAVVAGPLTMVVDKLSAVELMHNIDNRLSEPMFDADKPSAVRCNNQTDKQFYQHPHVSLYYLPCSLGC